MKLIIPNFTQNPIAFMRSCGYAFDREIGPVKPTGHGAGAEASCMRRVSGYDYPRYHAYIHTEKTNDYKLKTKNLIINLHIDQKKPSYGTTAAHSGEYDGELVEREMKRIRGFIV